ncbi:hypothetical protein TNCV_4221371 [Trichonephila clavipes]|nr:hypothetical protein TNCV_4221371 [Trichonephila clavipes]
MGEQSQHRPYDCVPDFVVLQRKSSIIHVARPSRGEERRSEGGRKSKKEKESRQHGGAMIEHGRMRRDREDEKRGETENGEREDGQ